ncbi:MULTISPECIES: NYN domain-containing protein [unclassified Marinovum]
MILPALLFVTFSAATIALVLRRDPALEDFALLCGVAGLAALVLLVRVWMFPPRRWIVLDGSNIMHWSGDGPSLERVRLVANGIRTQGYTPILWFDANVGYKVADRYMRPAELAKRLGLPKGRVFIAPKGTPADPLLLADAVRRKARVVSNDRFRDWQEQYPQLQRDDFVVRQAAGRGRSGGIEIF